MAALVADLLAATDARIAASDLPSDLDLSGARLLRSDLGVLIIDDASGATAEGMAAALKMLVQVAGPSGRSIAVLGALDATDAVADDAHDSIGRLAVRLNVRRLIVVGRSARHIHNAAGLEGSWDGESRLVGTALEAYDLLREDVREGDVVLVKASRGAGLTTIAQSLSRPAMPGVAE